MTQPHSLPNMEDQIWKGITEAISNAQNSGHLPVLELPVKSIENLKILVMVIIRATLR